MKLFRRINTRLKIKKEHIELLKHALRFTRFKKFEFVYPKNVVLSEEFKKISKTSFIKEKNNWYLKVELE